MATMLDFALRYLEKFGGVIPIASWTYEKEGKVVFKSKDPLISKWAFEPLQTEKEVKEKWNKYLRYKHTPNIGIPTGQINGGYIVIDFDRKPDRGIDGYDYLLYWQRKTGLQLPDTWSVITGSGGYHFYYHTDRPMRSYSNHEIGVDLRADGGLIICPPSMHENGNRYRWEIDPETPCAEADDAVFAFIDYCRPNGYQYQRPSTLRGTGGERKMILPEVIEEGGRTNALISFIGMMNRAGCLDETIEAAVRAENQKCDPPLTDDELKKTVIPAIYRFEKGVNKEEWVDKDTWIRQKKHEQRLKKLQEMERAGLL